MKGIILFIRRIVLLITIFCVTGAYLQAQNVLKRVGIVYIDSKGWTENQSTTQLTRIELGKLNLYDVVDRYDVEDMLKRNNKKDEACMSKACLLEMGKLLKADYVLSGSLEKFNNKVLVMFREVDVLSGNTTHTVIKDYPDAKIEMQVMIEVALKEMYSIKITDPNKQNLDKKNTMTTAVTNPGDATVSIGGPRFGFAFFTGYTANFMTRPKSQGGHGGYPAMFQFGYQFEKMYLDEGNLQALVEFIPSLSGMDQGLMLPSFTLLNGFRSAHGGWEFALGPTLTWTREAEGYMESGTWHFNNGDGNYNPVNKQLQTRSDTRGSIKTKPGLLLAVGKTFKSGKLNMPLNFYVVPRQNSLQFGVSYGFNAMKSKPSNN